ncbi:hypothetical protein ACWDA3_49795 [Nonomuraea rubra]
MNECRVCGLSQADPPWGEDGQNPTWAICHCCGTEFVHMEEQLRHAQHL